MKYVAYRLPLVERAWSPRYGYKVDPAELAALISFIDATRGTAGAVIEIGVGKGDTSVFLLEHLRTSRDSRPLLLFDTFAGFTPESITYEVAYRGKHVHDFAPFFRYADARRLKRNLRRAGFTNFRIHSGDAARFDWASIAPIGAVLLDVDLYQPTLALLEAIYPRLGPGGGIVIDDCVDGTLVDGALHAARDFTAAHGLSLERIGRKGGVIRRR